MRTSLVLIFATLALTTAACKKKAPAAGSSSTTSASSTSSGTRTVAATATIGKPPFVGGHRPLLMSDGLVVFLESEAVVARDAQGKVRWERRPFKHDEWLVGPLADGSVLFSDHAKHDVVAVDPITGADKWRLAIPLASAVDGSDGDKSNAEAAVTIENGGAVIVALSDARFIKLTAAKCSSSSKKDSGCITPLFTLKNESLSQPSLNVLPNGDLIVGESELLRQLSSTTGEKLAAFHVRESYAYPTPAPGGRLAVSIDDDLMLFDLSRCKTSASASVIFPWKAGKLHAKGSGECSDCVAPPAGCLAARPKLAEVSPTPPLVMSDGSIVVNTDDGLVHLSRDGNTVLWKTKSGSSNDDIAPMGRAIELNKEIVVLGSTVGDELKDAPIRVAGLNPETGKIHWRVEVPATAPAIISTDELILTANDSWIVAGYKTTVSWIRVSR